MSPSPRPPLGRLRAAGCIALASSLLAAAALTSTATARPSAPAAPTVEEPGTDTGNLTGPPLPPRTSGSSRTLPASPAFGLNIEELQSYVGQSTCDPVSKPGVVAFRNLLLAANPSTGDQGIVRACGTGGQSEHKEGRAWDWMVNASSPSQKATADRVLAWLLATDAQGHRWANARRFGIMYMIWNRQIWRAYDPLKGWQAYTGPDAHTGHVHFSFGWSGATKTSTWWRPQDSRGLLAVPQVGTPADFDADGADDTFWYGPGTLPDQIQWGTPPQGTPTAPTSVSVSATYTPLSGDFNGDGASDVLWYAQGTTPDPLWAGTPGARTFTPSYLKVDGTYRPVVGDFDGNGVDDVFWYGPGTLPDQVQWGTAPGSFAFTTVSTSVSGEFTPVVADLNGDGADDITWYGYGPMPDALWAGTPGITRFTSRSLTVNGRYRPFAGDFDGNGVDDIVWYGPGTAIDRVQWGTEPGLWASESPEVTVNGVYLPVVGDGNGDTADDITWYGVGAVNDARWLGKPGRHGFTPATTSVPGSYRPF